MNAGDRIQIHTPRARPLLLALVLAPALGLSGCRGDATGPEGRVARLSVVEPRPDTVAAGSTTPVTFRVRAVDGEGAPVEDVRLRLMVLAGEGSVDPSSVLTDAEGEAEASYLPGPAPGTIRLRIDTPGAPDVSPLVLEIVQRPSVRLDIRRVEGDGQEAEAGSQLPLPLRVEAHRADGSPAAGQRLAWTLTEAPDGARLEPVSLVTDPSGMAAALLTLSDEPGTHVVEVHGTGSTGGDSVRFTARGLASVDGDLRIDSVGPRPLSPGSEATVHGSGFPAADEAEVRVEGRAAPVLEADPGRIQFRVPESDGCRPDRRAGVRVLSGGTMSNGILVTVRGTGTRAGLEPGEIRTFSADEARCLQLPSGDRGRQLRLLVQNTARSGAGAAGLLLVSRAGAGSGGGQGALLDRPADRTGGAAERVPAAGAPSLHRRSAPALQARARRELRRRGARPASPGPPAALSGSDGATEPAEGDLLRLQFAVAPDLSVSCTDTSRTVQARVRAVGPSVVLAEDTAGSGGFSDADHGLLVGEFEELVFPTDTAYFGGPSDLDGNGRVVVLFSPRVNELTPRGADAAVGGFFLPLDLADSGDGDDAGVPGPGGETCPASNEAEVLYLPVPDPAGAHGPEFSRAEALRNARGIVAHELMHLLSAAQRVVLGEGGFLALEEVWLSEALSHLAEEVVGFAFLGMEPGSDLDFGHFSASRDGLEAFNTFHLQNFGRLQLFLLDPAATPVLSPVDPGGLAGLRMRGFGWLFLRWLADRFASPTGEPDFIRTLSVGGSNHLVGVENITAAAGTEWTRLLEDFALVPVLEGIRLPGADAGSAERRATAELATWQLREIYAGLRENPGTSSLFPLGYPLLPRALEFADGRRTLELGSGAASYFSLESATGNPALALSLRTTGGTPISPDADLRLSLVRLR